MEVGFENPNRQSCGCRRGTSIGFQVKEDVQEFQVWGESDPVTQIIFSNRSSGVGIQFPRVATQVIKVIVTISTVVLYAISFVG